MRLARPAPARIFHSQGEDWVALAGGLPDPLPSMPYGLAAPRAGEIRAALADGAVWRSADHGTTWKRVPVTLGTAGCAFALLPA